jgi:Family of unknown function (DUF6328)
MTASTPSQEPDGETAETPGERADRNFIELLQEFRVAVTGVQVLFAFLLTVPFSTGFASVSTGDRRLFYLALVSAALASVCYIAPAAQHRVLFRKGQKELLVRRANRLGAAGGVSLGVSMTAATLMVVDYLFDGVLPIVTAGALAALATWVWFLQPALTRMAGPPDDGDR